RYTHGYLLHIYPARQDFTSFPTRRSSDLAATATSCRSRSSTGSAPTQGAGSPAASSSAKAGPTRRRRSPAGSSTGPCGPCSPRRSEEHTSELQSRGHLVCRLLLGKNKQRL